jgi:hypothetical protein
MGAPLASGRLSRPIACAGTDQFHAPIVGMLKRTAWALHLRT